MVTSRESSAAPEAPTTTADTPGASVRSQPYILVFVEIPCADQQAACDFYRGVFGWNTQIYPEFTYAGADPDGNVGIGFPLIDGHANVRGQVVAYVSTPDIHASLAQASSLGGETVIAPYTIARVGHFALFDDGNGGRLGLFSHDPDATS